MQGSSVDLYLAVAAEERRKEIRRKAWGYLAAFLLAQVVVFLGFWAQDTYSQVTLNLAFALTTTFEIAGFYFLFRRYQLIHSDEGSLTRSGSKTKPRRNPPAKGRPSSLDF
jgi:hypothetical protein